MRKLWKPRGILLPLIILILAALACNAPTAPSSTDQTATAIVLTMTAGAPIAQVSGTQAVATPTNPPPNSTATFTAAPQQCTAKASQAVNVRTGPSTFHPILRILAQDATGIITGRNNDSSWWQIDGNGWVSAPYVTTSGACGSIPVASFPPAPPTFTPTPTSTPTATPTFTATSVTATATATATATTSGGGSVNFTVAWAGIWSCNGTGRISFQVSNTGADALESLQYRIEAPAGTYVNGAMTNTPFGPVPPLPAATCVQAGADKLASGATQWIHPVATMPSGHAARAIIKFCNADDLGGTCKEITYDFTY